MSGHGVTDMSPYIKFGSGHGFSFGVRAWTEMEIWRVKYMHMLKYKCILKMVQVTKMYLLSFWHETDTVHSTARLLSIA